MLSSIPGEPPDVLSEVVITSEDDLADLFAAAGPMEIREEAIISFSVPKGVMYLVCSFCNTGTRILIHENEFDFEGSIWEAVDFSSVSSFTISAVTMLTRTQTMKRSQEMM